MALVVNTNISSINAQKNLRRTESPLTQAYERLSSGLRINSAKDDAAGFGIAARMTGQINGLVVAMRNANDGISVAQVAESAIDEMITAVQRIYELSVQSASYNTSTDRDSLNREVTELANELSRIVTQTRYNGEQLLNQAKSFDIQVGVDVKESINISTANLSPNTIGVSTTYTSALTGTDIAKATGLSYLNGTGLGSAATIGGLDIGDAIATASDYKNNSLNLINRINTYTGTTTVTAFAYGNALVAGSVGASTGTVAAAVGVSAGFLTINGTQIGSFSAGSLASATFANLLTAINDKTATTGITAYYMDKSDFSIVSATTAGNSSVLIFTNTTGAAIDVSLSTSVSNGSLIVGTTLLASNTMSVAAGGNGKIIFNSNFTTASVTFDGTNTGAVFGVGSSSSSVALTSTSLNNINISTAADANIALLASKKSLDTFITEKGKLGAKINRLDSTIRNLEGTFENTVSARSRIQDADFALEVAKLTRAQVLQQSALSILSQANQSAQNVLSLLQ